MQFVSDLFKANIGELDEKKGRYSILSGNMALLQVQATLVSFIAAMLSFVLGLIMPRAGPAPESSAELLRFLYARRPHPHIPNDPRKPKSGLAE